MENISGIICELCKKHFSQKSSLNRHVKEIHLQPGFYYCKHCGLRFSKKYNLEVHVQHIHSKNLDPLKCKQSKGMFTKVASLKRRAQTHHKTCANIVSANSTSDLNQNDEQTLAESVLKELKQLQNEIQRSEDLASQNTNAEEQDLTTIEKGTLKVISIKDTLYPLDHFKLLKTQTIKRLDGINYLICEFCGKEFRKTYNYLRHRRIHTKVRPYVCILCKKSFPTTAQLKRHCSTHKLDEKFGLFHKFYKCAICKEGFSAIHKFDKHLCSPNSRCKVVFKCPHCFKSYKTLKSLLRHKHSKRDNELEMLKSILPTPSVSGEKLNETTRECNFCALIVDERILLKQHEKLHGNLFMNQCAKCHCSFVTKTALRIHAKVHVNSRKYKCHYCRKCYQTDQSCRRHMLNHLKLLLRTHETSQGENDSLVIYPTFIEHEKKSLIETAATAIVISGEKSKVQTEKLSATKALKYECSECEKSFRYKAWLTKHFKCKHTTDLQYECNNCMRKFRTNQSLQSHLIVHSTKRIKFTCQVCGRQYASSKSLKLHLRIHTQETPFKCNECSRLFRTSGHLIQHRKSNHKE